MIKTLFARMKQGYRTMPFPPKGDALPQRFLGRPCILSKNCHQGCDECKKVCPTSAIDGRQESLSLDLGKCIFCGECQKACANQAISFTREYPLAKGQREALIVRDQLRENEQKISKAIKNIFGRSLKLRQVSAGGCNACELDINVLSTPGFDLGRFGIQFVASPRHADGIVVTGPVTKNMRLALEKTYQAIPPPKLVIAVGACAISGGIYANNSETLNGADALLPVDLYIPGCPPHPLTILDGFLRLIGRLKT